jgi:tRNA (cmo5U34)-methyltransferase
LEQAISCTYGLNIIIDGQQIFIMERPMKKDRVFAEKKVNIKPFAFNREVAAVFDDMLTRSVPLYGESIQRQAQMVLKFYQDKTRIYDLGCSHGNQGILILEQFKKRTFTMIAVDNSRPMIEKYQKRLEKYQTRLGKDQFNLETCKTRLEPMADSHGIDLVCGGLEDICIENASVVLINLTLQFLDVKKRDQLIQRIFDGLLPGGILLLTEKTIHNAAPGNDLELDFHRQFKLENGYSALEISQKRDALEKILIPESLDIHKQRILNAGFSFFDIWLKWFNFSSMIAIK